MVTAKCCSDLYFPFPLPLSYAAIPSTMELGQTGELFWWMFWPLYQLKNKGIRGFMCLVETFALWIRHSQSNLSAIILIIIVSSYNNTINGQEQLSLWTLISTTCSLLHLMCKTLHTASIYLRLMQSEEISIELMEETNMVNAKNQNVSTWSWFVLRWSGIPG